MTKEDNKQIAPFVRVQTTGQRATTAKRVTVVQQHRPDAGDPKVTKRTFVAMASDTCRDASKPVKRITAADVAKISRK